MTEIIIVTPDDDFEATVKAAMSSDYDGGRFWDPAIPRMHPGQAVELIAAPPSSVVVLGPKVSGPAALDLAAAFDQRRPDVCTLLISAPNAKILELALRAGVRDVLPPDVSTGELQAALSRASETVQRRRSSSTLVEPEKPTGRLVTVLGPKGGSGKTMVAANLAVGLAQGAPWQVVLVDLDLQFGDIANSFSLTPQSTMTDAARADGKLSSTALKVFLEPYPSGLYTLCAPLSPAEADDVSSTTVGQVLDLLVAEFAYVVVDTGSGLDEHALTAIERSTDIAVVCATDVPSVRSVRKALDALDLLGMTTAQRHLVLNRADARVGLAQRDIEATIGLAVEVAIPSSRSVPISLNQGTPLIEADPRSPVSKVISGLAKRFLSVNPMPAKDRAKPARAWA